MTLNALLATRLAGFRRKSFRSFGVVVAASGIFTACTFVLVSIGVLAGFQRAYEHAILDFNAHLIVFNEGGLGAEDQNRIRKVFDARTDLSYSRYRFRETLVPTSKGLRPVVIKGLDWQKIGNVYPLTLSAWENSGAQAYVGKDLAGIMPDLRANGKLRLLSLKDIHGTSRVRYESLPIAGTFASGLYDFDSQFVLMDLADLQKRFGGDDSVEGFEIRLKNIDELDGVVSDLRAAFGSDYEIVTWQQLNRSLLVTLDQERREVFAIALLVLLIACLNVFGFNFLFFLERKTEFLVLASLGMGLKRLRRLMMRLSLMLGGGAAAAAMVISLIVLSLMQIGGVPLDAEIYFVDRVPVAFELWWFAAFLAAALLLCVATSWLAGLVVLRRDLAGELTR
jgi:lipoprotein-releasing system permease protein